MPPELSVILATYNERESIVELVRAILDAVAEKGVPGEVIIVDDNSPDGTAAALNSAFAGNSFVKVVVRENERGLATAIRRGIEEAKAEKVLLMDADFNHSPEYIPPIWDTLERADIVVGSRYARGGGMDTSRARYLGSWLFNLFARCVLRVSVRDCLSGFLLFDKKKLRGFDLDWIFRGYGDYCIRLLYCARKEGFVIKEVPVIYRLRKGGESKTDFFVQVPRYTKAVLGARAGYGKKRRG